MDEQNASWLLNETFNQNFELHKFIKFVTELFNGFTVIQKKGMIWEEYRDYIDSYNLLGSYKDSSKRTIDVLVIELKRNSARDRARTMQRNFVAKYLGNAEKDAALVAFYDDNDPKDWRFSFVKIEYNLVKGESGKVKPVKELTPARRYSFLVGVNEPNHTCKSRFLKLMKEDEINPSFSEIEQAFSIDNVTKEFFERYRRLFLELKESVEKVLKKDKNARNEFEKKNISTVDFSKKLLGQIVFIYFLQKKGWLGVQKMPEGGFSNWGTGPKDFLHKLFDKAMVTHTNFFNEFLEPLFYEALATQRDDDYYSRFNCKIPFLNGGLFEPINDYNWTEIDIVLENSIFERIFSIFDKFNFTVKEDEPLEKEVAVDPEMLGKVFENLLEITDRKSKGAFYTPREIVHYMCQQSLINYIETNTSNSRKDIEKFIQMGGVPLDYTIRTQEKKKNLAFFKHIDKNHELDELLKKIKIVDPACGSGAFLIGMLNEIVKARSLLATVSGKEQNTYDLKREIIENCLYGVDIESSAVEISKLRFWLSLVVDELDMGNIKPLPNLEYKIMCGNSLLEEFEGIKLFDENSVLEVKKKDSFEFKQIKKEIDKLYKEKGQVILGKSKGRTSKEIDREIKKLERQSVSKPKKDKIVDMTLNEVLQKKIKESKKKLAELKKLQEQFFNEQNRSRKKDLRREIYKLEWGLIRATLEDQGNEEALKKLQQHNKNRSKPFFLWKLYFAEIFQRQNPGFDVIIGNPPYVKEYTNRSVFDGLKNSPYYQGKMDIWYFFACKGIDLLREKGVECFIAPNNWMSNAGASIFRNKVVSDTQIIQFIDFSNFKVFNAGIHTMIYLLKKSKTNNSYILFYSKLLDCSIDSKKLDTFLHSKKESQHFLKYPVEFDRTKFKDEFITFLRKELIEFLNKIDNQRNFFLSNKEISQGIVSPQENLNRSNAEKLNNQFPVGKGIFVLKNNERNALDLNKDELKLIKPYYTTDEISRYRFLPEIKRWIIYTRPNIKGSIYRYPNIKKHLDNFKKIITSDNKPYGLHRARDLNFFKGTKILSLRKCSKPSFTLVDEDSYVSQTFFLIKTDRVNMKYLVGLLNSSLISFWLYHKGKLQGDLFQIDYAPLVKIPLKKADEKVNDRVIKLVDQIISNTKDDDYLDNSKKQLEVKRLEKDVDEQVYKLYGLTEKEIEIINEFKPHQARKSGKP